MFRGATYQLGTTAPPLPPNSFVPERRYKKKNKKKQNKTNPKKKVTKTNIGMEKRR